MFQRECLLYAWVLDYTRKLVADLDETEMAVQPAPGLNTPLWVLGHLAICTDYAASLLGLPMVCPKEWHQMFGPGSDPAQVPTPHPSKKQLVDALEAGHAWVSEAAHHARAEPLSESHTLEPLRKALPTRADLLAHLMTTHPCLHLGQLSAWRRLRGKKAVLGL